MLAPHSCNLSAIHPIPEFMLDTKWKYWCQMVLLSLMASREKRTCPTRITTQVGVWELNKVNWMWACLSRDCPLKKHVGSMWAYDHINLDVIVFSCKCRVSSKWNIVPFIHFELYQLEPIYLRTEHAILTMLVSIWSLLVRQYICELC